MRRAYLVNVLPSDENAPSRAMRYAALAETPEEAVQAVRPLLGEDARLECDGETLSPVTAMALGLRPGQGRLV